MDALRAWHKNLNNREVTISGFNAIAELKAEAKE
jgi:hypothetical protein